MLPADIKKLYDLILTAAKFAYDIRRDRKKDQQLAPEALKRRVRVMLDERGYPDTLNRAKAIEAVVQAVQEAERRPDGGIGGRLDVAMVGRAWRLHARSLGSPCDRSCGDRPWLH